MVASVNTPRAADAAASTQVTIKDLAEELGISKTTVSDALSGNGRVASATRERVQALASERGYVHNAAARSLRTRIMGALGLYLPPVMDSSPFYMDFVLGAVDATTEHGFDLILFSQRRTKARRFAIDGAVVLDATAEDEFPRRLHAAGIPLVAAGRVLGRESDHAVIQTPDAEMADQMFHLMRQEGAQHVAFVTPLLDFRSSWAYDVTQAYQQWCDHVGQEPAMRSVSVSCTDVELETAIGELLDEEHADALVVAADGWAKRVRPILTRHGRDVTADFQLASLTGNPRTDGTDPEIAYVDPQARKFGAESFRLLVDILRGELDPTIVRTHPAQLVPRR